MYAAGDGFVNPLGWSDAHIACKYGDVGGLRLEAFLWEIMPLTRSKLREWC